MTVRKYSSRSQQTTLSSAITDTATSMTVVSGSALMGGKTLTGTQTYTVVIDPDTSLEEIVDVTLYSSGNTLTITRGRDGSSQVAHSAGAVVRHMVIGRDLQEANDHIEASTSVHGITDTAALVTLTGSQTLSGKTLTTPTVNGATISGTVTSTATLTGGTVNATTLQQGGVQAVTTTDSQTLTNKTLTTPTIASFVNATHDHTTSAGGGALSTSAISGIQEYVEDTVGAMVSSNTESGIAVTYDDSTGKLNFDVSDPVITLSGDVTGSATITNLGNTTITTAVAADTIVNADINSSAQIAYSKLNLSNSIVNADINASAAIDWTKIAPSSTVSSTELGYLDGVTSAIQTQLDSKLATSTAASTYAPLASPALTGVPTAPTAAANTNTTQIATTAYVQTEINDLIAAAPGALDTLNELAAALGNDASFSTTVTNSLATKLNLSGGTMTGAIAMGTNKITGMGNPTANQDAATKYYVDNVTVAPSNLTGPITSTGNVTAVAAQTGTGSTFVMQTSPTLTTPNIGVATATSINGTTIPSSKTLVATDSTQYVVPSQTGNSGKYLTTDGTTSSWGTVNALPSQTGNSGKYLTTNGSTASWASIVTDPTPSVFMLMGA
jgi:hypothetical protein